MYNLYTIALIRLLEINYRQRKTNAYVKETITKLVGKYEPLLTTIKRRKLSFYGYLCRDDSLSKTIMQGIPYMVKGTIV